MHHSKDVWISNHRGRRAELDPTRCNWDYVANDWLNRTGQERRWDPPFFIVQHGLIPDLALSPDGRYKPDPMILVIL